MDVIRLGIIGLGGMGGTHAKCVNSGEIPRLQLTAVADMNSDRLKWAKENLNSGIRLFTEGRELIDSGVCDAILVATPHYMHPEYAIYGMEHGLHVIIEKPSGVYTKQVRLMNETADRSGGVFAIMLNQRTNCVYRKLHEMIVSKELGEIKRVNWIITDWYRTQAYYDAAGWKATWDGEGGGVLLNQSPHQLDLLQWLCGLPVRVRAFCHEGKWHDIEVEDDVSAYMEFENGATGVFVTSTGDAPGTNRLEITFEKGRAVCIENELRLDRLSVNERDFCKTEKNGFAKPEAVHSIVETDGKNEQHAGVLKAFVSRILDGGELVADGREGIRGLALSNAMYLSSWLDKTVELPVDEELFLKELEKRRAGSRKKAGTGVVFDTKGSY